MTALDGWRARLRALAVPEEADGAHDASHLDRVWAAAQRLLASHPEADALVVLAAAGRALAGERLALLRDFRRAFAAEWGGEPGAQTR